MSHQNWIKLISSKSPFCAVWFNASQLFTACFGVCFDFQQSTCHLLVFGGFSVWYNFGCGVLISLMFYCTFLVWRWCLAAWCLIQFVLKIFLRMAVHAAVFHVRSLMYWVIKVIRLRNCCTIDSWQHSHVVPKLALQLQIQFFFLEPSLKTSET